MLISIKSVKMAKLNGIERSLDRGKHKRQMSLKRHPATVRIKQNIILGT